MAYPSRSEAGDTNSSEDENFRRPPVEKQSSENCSYGEDEDLQPPPKKQRRRLILEETSDDEDQQAYGDYSSNTDEDYWDAIYKKMRERRKMACRSYSEDGYAFPPRTDKELLDWEWADWSDFDGWNIPEVYSISVESDFCEEPDCRRMLNEIGCEDRFIACSIERPSCFYAKLNEQEANKLEGVNGIFEVHAFRLLFSDD